jgi:hypothetical protein
MSTGYSLIFGQFILFFIPVAILTVLSIYALLLAIKALKIYISKNS